MDQQKTGEVSAREETLRAMGLALHDLCQPLTTLQCRLEMAEMLGTPEALHDAVKAGMDECMRMADAVGKIRSIVRSAAAEDESGAAA